MTIPNSSKATAGWAFRPKAWQERWNRTLQGFRGVWPALLPSRVDQQLDVAGPPGVAAEGGRAAWLISAAALPDRTLACARPHITAIIRLREEGDAAGDGGKRHGESDAVACGRGDAPDRWQPDLSRHCRAVFRFGFKRQTTGQSRLVGRQGSSTHAGIV